MGLLAGSVSGLHLPWPQFLSLGFGGRAPLLLPGGGTVARLIPPHWAALSWQHKEPLPGIRGPLCARSPLRPRPRYQHGEAAACAGGASLGRCRPRHVLDTGLSGLQPLHKNLGRRRNKGLFHAATEKPQISLYVLCTSQAGGAASKDQTPLHGTPGPIPGQGLG